MVFCGLYPTDAEDYEVKLNESLIQPLTTPLVVAPKYFLALLPNQ